MTAGSEVTLHEAKRIYEGVRQCTAKAKQSGERCKRRPIRGGTTCTIHGSGTTAAKSAGLARLLAARDPAIDQLVKLARKADTDAVQLRAVEGILDRTGLPRGVGMPVRSEAEQRADLVAALTLLAERARGARS